MRAFVRAGGRVANIGVHGKPVTVHLKDLWIRDIILTTGLVDTDTTPDLLRLLAHGPLDIAPLMPLDGIVEVYDIFARAADAGALNVVLTRSAATLEQRRYPEPPRGERLGIREA